MSTHMLRAAVCAATTAAIAVLTVSPATASDSDQAAAEAPKGVAFAATHGTAVAEGTRWLENGAGTTLVLRGQLKNSGSDCYSVWFQFTNDFMPRPPQKHVTQCGRGTVLIDFQLPSYRPTTTGTTFVCKGQDLKDCGQRNSVTSWPVGNIPPTAG